MKHVNHLSRLGTKLTMQRKLRSFFPLIPAPFTDWKKECGKLVLWKQELPSAIEWAFSAVKASDCLGWFRSYDCVQ